jgi:hypothetical protein
VVPGWGLFYLGHYEAGLNVLAWEGFFAYWATAGARRHDEAVAGERRDLRRLNTAFFAAAYLGQIFATSLASPEPDGRQAEMLIGFEKKLFSMKVQRRFGRPYRIARLK